MVILLFLLCLVGALALALGHTLSHLRHARLLNTVKTATNDTELYRLFRYFGFPRYLTDTDVSHGVAWMNQLMAIAWSHIDKAASTWAIHDATLEKLLNSNTFWRPRWMLGTGVKIYSFMLGQEPVTVTGIKVFPHPTGNPPAQELLMDIDFEWASKLQCGLQLRSVDTTTPASIIDRILGVAYSTVGVRVVLEDLVARGRMRVEIQPLLDILPVFGAVKVSFLEAPTFTYQVSSFGANPLMIPGLESWVDEFVRNQVMQPFTFPEGLTVNVGQLFGVDIHIPVKRPQGMLVIKVVDAVNVPRMDLFGLSDCYVKYALIPCFSSFYLPSFSSNLFSLFF